MIKFGQPAVVDLLPISIQSYPITLLVCVMSHTMMTICNENKMLHLFNCLGLLVASIVDQVVETNSISMISRILAWLYLTLSSFSPTLFSIKKNGKTKRENDGSQVYKISVCIIIVKCK